MFKAVVFDFDGVITDGIPLQDKAYLEIFKRYNINTTIEHLHTTIGLTSKEVISQIFGEFNKKQCDAVKEHGEILFELYKSRAEMPSGLIDFLDECKRLGLRIALASSTNSEILKMILTKFNIRHYFESVVGGESVAKGKPNPEMIKNALLKLRINPINAIAIDDAKSGIIAAKKLDMFAIAYLKYSKSPINEADVNVENFDEINMKKRRVRMIL